MARRFTQFLLYIAHYEDIENPLLRAVADRGGAIWFSFQGGGIETDIANHFKLPQPLRDLTDPDVNSAGKLVWRMMVQQARRKLVQKGDFARSEHDRWQMTAQGYERIGRTPPTQIG
ncbi:MAG: hypothetical protein K8U57_02335 [Planctomycetes bacterium]|nr:hypothetical protein [Planctomycetota bacterium]